MMKKIFFTLFLFAFSFTIFSQSWIASPVVKRFIENRSQFDGRDNLSGSQILFGTELNGTQIYFTEQGLTYRFDKREQKNKENKEEREREKKFYTSKEWEEHEKEEHAVKIETDLVHMQWENSNPNIQVVAEERVLDYFSYMVNGRNINHVSGYEKIVYKNLYPNIDLEYVFHEKGGVKYSFILHPGADVSQIKMKYDKKISLKGTDIHIPTICGDIIDHAPFSFYADDKKEIASSYSLKNNIVSFNLKLSSVFHLPSSIVIDPWSQTPTIPSSNAVQECERDGAGNVYIIGGETPMRLLKYNSAGVLQWTYNTPYDTSGGGAWLGTFATDLAGNSYVTCGSTAALTKVNTSGANVYSVTGGSMDEYWNIAFNCDQTKLIIGGTRLTGIPTITGSGVIFDINTSNGSVNSLKTVGYTTPGFGPIANPNEVRSITSSHNGRYYYLTLDTMGCIDQNFSACSAGGKPIFGINSGYKLGYKCEDYRPNNGNGGIMAIKANANFVYTQNGSTIQKRSLASGAILASAPIPGGKSTTSMGFNVLQDGGIDIDTCGNVYVGSDKQVVKYDANLNQLATAAVAFTVYDVCVSTAGNVIACGAVQNNSATSRTGYVQSIASFAACDPLTLQCCDASICKAGPLCTNSGPITLSSAQSGGTWSGTGITNSSTGTFDPSVSGSGTFVITYSMPCGKDSLTMIVNTCAMPNVCVDGSGNFIASGGAGPTYTWYQWQNGGSTPITTQAQCTACNSSYTWFAGQCLNSMFQPVTSCTTPAGWVQISSSATITPSGNYPIKLQDQAGDTIVLNSASGLPSCSSTLNVTASHVNAKCNGQCNGTATATVSSGTAPYTYAWSPSGGNSSAATGLCAGTYTVLVTDAAALTKTATVTITQPTALTASATVTSASCGSGGSATATANGGSPTYTYSWNSSPPQNTSTATGLAGGNYTATITDANGCTTTTTVAINTASGGTVSVNSTAIQCNGGTSSASATMNGGTSPFTYSWSSGQSTSSVSNLSAGNYTCTVTDASGCTTSQTVAITQPTAITSSVTVVNTTCGANTGSASVTASGGTGTLSYNWSTTPPQTTQSISNLGVGNYSCTITDANGCTQVTTALVSNANGPTASITNTVMATCKNNDGSATVTASGGTSPYTYAWNTTPPQNTQTATGLPAGTYTVVVTDASGCSNLQTVTITQPGALTASVSSTPASCGANDGTATANPNGGSSPYTYLWSNFNGSQTATGLAAGNYSVIVTDANGCSNTFTATVGNSNPPVVSTGVDVTISSGNSTSLSASGATNYSWSPANGLSCTNCSNPVANPTQTTTYCVYTTSGSCIDSACVKVTVEPPCSTHYLLPNAFSPNDDNENDVLRLEPPDIVHCIKEYRLSIYDRWGEKVFESISPADVWDGMAKGRKMNSQVVAYYLHIVFLDNTTEDKQGNISLVR